MGTRARRKSVGWRGPPPRIFRHAAHWRLCTLSSVEQASNMAAAAAVLAQGPRTERAYARS
eukprot:3301862-Alexandrium_andersonii.AAC.1